MRRIALDLEMWTDGIGPTMEIIQVGYTVFDTKDGIIATSGDYVKINKPLHPYIINLTGIKQHDIDTKGVSLAEAYSNLLDFCEKHEVKFGQLVTWGSGDLEELKTQLDSQPYPQYYGQDIPKGYEMVYTIPMNDNILEALPYLKPREWKFGRAELNLKAVYQMYATVNDKKRSGGLSSCLKREGLEFTPFLDEVAPGKFRQRGKHDARADALTTANFYLYLQEKMKDYGRDS